MMPKLDRACARNCRDHLLCWWQTATACVCCFHSLRVSLHFCFGVWYRGKWEYTFCTLCGWFCVLLCFGLCFWSVCGMWEIVLCFHKCYVFQLDREKPAGIHASFRNWSRRHHPGILGNKSFSISSQGGCVLAEIAAHGKPLASTFAQGRSRRGDRHDAAACAAYCPCVFCMLKFLITLSCSGRWHTGHHF